MERDLTRCFLYGVFHHTPLLETVLGRLPEDAQPTVVSGFQLLSAAGRPETVPVLAPAEGSSVAGLVVEGLTEQDFDRLNLFAVCAGGADHTVSLHQSGQLVEMRAFGGAPASSPENDDIWSFDDWHADWSDLQTVFAQELLSRLQQGQDRDELIRLAPFVHARAWSRILAKTTAPTDVRSAMSTSQDVIWDKDLPGFNGYFQLKTFQLRRRDFAGALSAPMHRAGFVAYDAALVLPYDPQNDLVMLVEQMRFGPILRGDAHPWVFEPAAGLIDATEDPAETAKREAMEETGLDIQEVELMSRVYASPGYSSEFFHCYLAIANLAGWTTGVSGLSSEFEDIKSHVLTFDHAMALCDSGEINAGPLVMMLHWLARHRARLRAGG